MAVCLLKSLSMTVTVMVLSSCSADPCIRSYLNSTINDISSNTSAIPSIYYLGHKLSTNECRNSCSDFNYLCDTSFNDKPLAYNYPDEFVQFNNTECSITISDRSDDVIHGSWLLVTSDLVSNEYILELQLSMSFGDSAGLYFKSNDHDDIDLDQDYFFGVEPGSKKTLISGYTANGKETYIYEGSASPKVTYNTKYNVSVHVINNTFTTYFNGEQIFKTNEIDIDGSIFNHSYAGIYGYQCDAIFHSFKVKFPNHINIANEDKKNCTAFVYDKADGDCYGYYGNDYAEYDCASTSKPTLTATVPDETEYVGASTSKPTLTATVPDETEYVDITVSTIEEINNNENENKFFYIQYIVVFVVIVVIGSATVCFLYKDSGEKPDEENMIEIILDEPKATRGKDDHIMSNEDALVVVDEKDEVNPTTKGNDVNIGDDEFVVKGDDETTTQ